MLNSFIDIPYRDLLCAGNTNTRARIYWKYRNRSQIKPTTPVDG